MEATSSPVCSTRNWLAGMSTARMPVHSSEHNRAMTPIPVRARFQRRVSVSGVFCKSATGIQTPSRVVVDVVAVAATRRCTGYRPTCHRDAASGQAKYQY